MSIVSSKADGGMVSGTGSVPYSQVSLGFESRSAMILRDTFTMCIYIYIYFLDGSLGHTDVAASTTNQIRGRRITGRSALGVIRSDDVPKVQGVIEPQRWKNSTPTENCGTCQ